MPRWIKTDLLQLCQLRGGRAHWSPLEPTGARLPPSDLLTSPLRPGAPGPALPPQPELRSAPAFSGSRSHSEFSFSESPLPPFVKLVRVFSWSWG